MNKKKPSGHSAPPPQNPPDIDTAPEIRHQGPAMYNYTCLGTSGMMRIVCMRGASVKKSPIRDRLAWPRLLLKNQYIPVHTSQYVEGLTSVTWLPHTSRPCRSEPSQASSIPSVCSEERTGASPIVSVLLFAGSPHKNCLLKISPAEFHRNILFEATDHFTVISRK